MDVYLGIPDEPISAADAPNVDAYTSSLGGRARWLPADEAAAAATPNSANSIARALRAVPPTPICSGCRRPMALLLQSYDPLAEFPLLERVLYVFACLSCSKWCFSSFDFHSFIFCVRNSASCN